jgi:thiamine biosynthesis lipoprotein
MTGLRRVEQVMGTAISVQIADPLPRRDLDLLMDEAFAWFRDVDRRFSTYQDDSEITLLDRGERSIANCSPAVRDVLDACGMLARATDGYFDVHATGRLDPSGYVKGWAVQRASDRLLAAGAANHCLNAGGDVRVRGHETPGVAWRVGIRHPFEADKLAWVVTGTDLGVATSGTYERGFHVIDPRCGRAARGLCSVSVVGPDLGLADAYATAAVAMGLPGLSWLATLDGYEAAVVTAARAAYRSDGLPLAPP